MAIPKIIHQLWIGDVPPPTKWLATWKEMNPDWEYVFWDNEKVYSRKWKNQHLIDHYTERAKKTVTFKSARGAIFDGEKAKLFAWHVIADILRYEILHEYGGYMASADSICVKPLTEAAPWLDYDLYTVNTGRIHEERYHALEEDNPNYKLLKSRYHPDNCSPILAASKGNDFLKKVISRLGKIKRLGEAVDTTGNVFMGKMLNKYKPENILINPYYLKDDPRRQECYSRHFSGTTTNSYHLGR
jgi:mannosyltransferase OCH1-like enzyme